VMIILHPTRPLELFIKLSSPGLAAPFASNGNHVESQ
jgi:hypothetical protein